MDEQFGSIEDASVEDYSFEQLKEAVLRRQSAMERIKQIYKDDPRASRSPVDSGFSKFFSQDFGGNGNGKVTYEPFHKGMAEQEEFLRQSKLDPELLQLKMDETDPFTAMLRKVTAKGAGGGGFPFETKVIAPGVAIVTNRSTGLSTTLGVDDVNKFMSAVERHYKTLIEGGVTDVKLAQSQAWSLANADVEKAKSHRNVPGMSSDSPTNPSVRTPAITPEGTAIPPIGTKPALVRGSEPAIARPVTGSDGKAALDNIANRFISLQRDLQNKKIDKPTFDMRTKVLNEERMRIMSSEELMPSSAHEQGGTTTSPTIAQGSAPPTLMSLQDKKVAEKLAERDVASYDSAIESKDAMLKANQSLLPMEGALLSGMTTSGGMHETLNKAGSYLSILDPKATLSQMASNDTGYLNRLMGLVRVDIKALGAGTAVSNLDLIVSQKASGDLRNPTQGNLINIGLVKLYNATNSALAQKKIDYFDTHNNLKGYKSSTEPTHALIHKVNPYGRSTMTSYDVESKEDWVGRLAKANGGKLPDEGTVNRLWKKYADDSVRDVFKEKK